MIRHLHPTDSPGLLQFSQSSGRGETCTLVGALRGGPGGFPTVKYASIALSPRAWQSCWVEAHRGRIDAVLRAGPRSGPQAWEVGELYLRNSNADLALDLLEQIAVPAGGAGAHRIFVRVPANSVVFEEARKAGYSAVYRETVYRSDSARRAVNNLGIPEHALQMRPKTDADSSALYRMHNATTPVDIRMKLGPTSQDWASGCEQLGRKMSELVLVLPNGDLGAIVQRNSTRSGHSFDLRWAPEAASELPGLVAAAMTTNKDAPVSVAVPEFRPALSHLLVTLGFEEQAQYQVMVKPLAQRITESQRAFAAIS